MAGELTIPIEDGPHKAVIFISGSGPQNRDEALAGHRPFLVLSDHLTRAGYAVLRYDDRGFAESTGSFEDASLRDFADDAAGAFRFLEGHQDIDASGIGFLGHSEGGYIAPSAAQMVDPAFLVFLAGPARPFYDVLATQAVDFMRAEGAEEADSKKVKSQYDAASAILAKSVPLPEIREQLDTYLKSEGIRARDRRSFLDSLATSAIAKSRAGNW
nr:alpha/beta fold hydrolase [Ruegeria atlantica]